MPLEKFSLVIGNLDRQSERQGQIYDNKLLNSRFCACAVKMLKLSPNTVPYLHNIISFIANCSR